MRIIRATNPLAIDFMRDKLVPPEGMDRGAFLEQLREFLTTPTEALFVSMLFDGDELLYFVMAYDSPGTDSVELYQCWKHPERYIGPKWKNAVWDVLVEWALALGKSRIRGEECRGIEMLAKEQEMLPRVRIMEKVITEVEDATNKETDEVEEEGEPQEPESDEGSLEEPRDEDSGDGASEDV